MNFEGQFRSVLAQNSAVIPVPVIVDTWFRSSGTHLDDLEGEVWDMAAKKIADKGMDSVKALMKGDYFWHPSCVKCARCWRHVPECREAELCNRCAKAV